MKVGDLEKLLKDSSLELELLEQKNRCLEWFIESKGEKIEEEYVEAIRRSRHTHRGIHHHGHSYNSGKLKAKELTIDDFNKISGDLVEYLDEESSSSKETGERVIDTLRAVLEETECRINDMKHDAYRFKRDVVVAGIGERGQITNEAVLKNMEFRQRITTEAIDKLRGKSTSYGHRIKRVELEMDNRKEHHDVPHYIDFNTLQIENKQYASKLVEKSQEQVVLKRVVNTVSRELNELKTKLGTAEDDLADMYVQQAAMERSQIQTQHEIREVQKNSRSTKKEHVELSHIHRDLNESKMPELSEYIEQKVCMHISLNFVPVVIFHLIALSSITFMSFLLVLINNTVLCSPILSSNTNRATNSRQNEK